MFNNNNKFLLIYLVLMLSACGQKSNSDEVVTSKEELDKINATVAKELSLEERKKIILDAMQIFHSKGSKDNSNITHDAFKKVAYYHPAFHFSADEGTRVEAYVAVPDNYKKTPIVFMEFCYQGRSILNFNKVKILADEKLIYDREMPDSALDRTAGSGYFFEVAEEPLDYKDFDMLKSIIDAKHVQVRLEGAHDYEDHELSEKEKKALGQVLIAHEQLKKLDG
ncbi:hypothetical protein [Aquitalea denitrificans]|uniref:hypothetical protein n=1 Tax=Aquitalea denitrificans TaxID=519081 RepID=UPI00135A5C92|nr:hypothetical protein [Aquitalea denitrificans]